MPYLKLHEGFNQLLHICREFHDMWPSVTFRILGRQVPDSDHVKTVICNFQATPNKGREYSQTSITAPLVMEGTVGFQEFLSLISAWSNGESGTLGDVVLECPDIHQVDFDQSVLEDGLYNPLLTDLPTFQSKYRFHRISGGGNDQDSDVETQVYELCRDLEQLPDEWMMEYLGVRVTPGVRPYLHMIFPICVGINTSYDKELRQCQVKLAYRRPMSKNDFWVRMSSGRWQASLPSYSFQDEQQADGWHCSSFEYPLPSDDDPDRVNVWVGRLPQSRSFEWSTTIAMEKPRTPVQVRQDFLRVWYDYAGQQIAKHAQRQEPGTRGKSGNVSEQLEILVSNVFSAMGFSVFFGGTILKTPGIDLVAFDSAESNVYVISVTVSNDLDKKLRTFLPALHDLETALHGWLIRPVMVSLESTKAFLHNDFVNAQQAGVVLLSEEDLEPLSLEYPDLDAFRKHLVREFDTLKMLTGNNTGTYVPIKL
ncbi:hypothetical protein FY534_03455 [Alicyclobacillus sp. TC]|uniref:hypothetical protein n=1 Tax=Alicyclobacillus sp. TC TaxID=2606450 RepID=UPI001932802D|nr:hypothetical protein [Alicyclobacillus sp. TC]QRF22839.1 hypothetical protein FY534_03455 [Alicyclobacillus sp. TC]